MHSAIYEETKTEFDRRIAHFDANRSRIDALAAHNARMGQAIKEATSRIRHVARQEIYDLAAREELLQTAKDLEAAAKSRADDERNLWC